MVVGMGDDADVESCGGDERIGASPRNRGAKIFLMINNFGDVMDDVEEDVLVVL